MKAPLGLFVCVAAFGSADAAIFTVTTTNDSGAGSLRDAIVAVNAAAGPHVINFSIASGGLTIIPSTPLPDITQPVALNATTQPGYSGTPLIELSGAALTTGTPDGLRLLGGNSAVRGFFINSFRGDGIEIATNGNNVVENCIIGLDAAEVDRGNLQNGIRINQSPNNRIGGTTAATRNVISGNNQQGILIAEAGSMGNIVEGNYIGTDSTGTLDRGNSGDGVQIDDAPGNIIGGNTPGARNLISGNNGDGVQIFTVGATNNLVQGNYIGTAANGSAPLPNNGHGILFTSNARGNTVGGSTSSVGNLIAFNGGDGVNVTTGTNNAIRANSIFMHGGAANELGIDLGPNGIASNDAGDGDTGANYLQNFPILTSASITPGGTTVQGTLNSRANTPYIIDLYANQSPNPSGSGEGRFWLGSTNVTTDGSGNLSFTATLTAVAQGRFISATATDPAGNTSEFATNTIATSTIAPGTFTVSNTNDSGVGSLRQAIFDSNARISSGRNTIQFGITGAGPHFILPLSALPPVTESVDINGYSQLGSTMNADAVAFNGILRVVLDGANAGAGMDGLVLAQGNSIVRGLVIVGFSQDGIEIQNGTNTISGNIIGLDLTGADRGNSANGVLVTGGANLIGGVTPAARNVISGNSGAGVYLNGAAYNVVQGNLLGTDVTGTLDPGSNGDGVTVSGPNNLIGGTTPAARNVISGNNAQGVEFTTSGATNNAVLGNFIGTDITGVVPLPNNSHGVYISSNLRGTRVGGIGAGEANVIAFNSGDGVFVISGTENPIRGNSIFENTGLGIDLNPNNPTLNDAGDADTGANQLQNFPTITNAVIAAASTLIQGTLNSQASTTYQLDFYSSASLDPSGYGEGQTHLGSLSVPTDGSGNAPFSISVPVRATGRYLSATATDPAGNTSEFSIGYSASSTAPALMFSVVNTNDSGPGSLRQAILDARAPSATNNLITFNIPGGGVKVISPLTELPPVTEAITIDGYTQPGAATNTSATAFNGIITIVLQGSNTLTGVDGLQLESGNAIVRGLNIINFASDGIEITSAASNCVVEGCIIGVDLSGNPQSRRQTYGVFINGSANCRVGATAPAARNVIGANYSGVNMTGGGMNVVEGCLLGIDATGMNDVGNFYAGVDMVNSISNRVGGTSAASRNVISGNNTYGVRLQDSGCVGNQVLGNYIGTGLTGSSAIPNGSGVNIAGARNTTVGGVTAGARNIISGNSGLGIYVLHWITPATDTVIQGNYIGTDVTGQSSLANNVRGVFLSVGNALIGGDVPGAGNLISGNIGNGLEISGTSSTNVIVQGNLIGVNIAGVSPVPNAGDGVVITGNASRNQIGGTNTGAGNIIAFNDELGVSIESGTNNAVLGNSIFENDALGLSLGSPGLNPNDLDDADAGPNFYQNFPELQYGIASAGTVVIGSLNSLPNRTYRIEFFANATCDPIFGYGEG